MTAWLLMSALGGANAEISSDIHIQSDRLFSTNLDSANQYAIGSVASDSNLAYIRSTLELRYPLRSVLLHAAAQGISISDTVYLMTLADPDRAADFYSVAVELLPDMPGWVCGSDIDLELRYPKHYDPSEMGANGRVIDVANRFFTEGHLIGYRAADGGWGFPDATKGQYHFKADVDELIGILQEERARTKTNSWWYQPGPGRTADTGTALTPLLVSIYKYDKSIAVDATLDQLQRLKATGQGRVPVIVIYNDSYTLPVSRECKVTDPSDPYKPFNHDPLDMTLNYVADAYFNCHRRITPPREWNKGDYHIMVSLDELVSVFGLPRREDVNAVRWNKFDKEMRADGFTRPLKVTMNLDSGMMWAGERERIGIAKEMGIERIPVVFLTHQLTREDCYQTPNCWDAICLAAVAAGADFAAQDCTAQTNQMMSTDVMPAVQRDSSAYDKDIEAILNQAAGQLK